MAIEIALVGASGRMGARIDALASLASDLRIAARVGRASAASVDARIDVVIDFSSEAGAAQALSIARSHRAALLVGTTGLSEAMRATLADASRSIPVLVAPNTSLGVAVTRRLARIAAEILGPAGWKVDIVESHHDRKKDAPSGTAIAIAAALAEGGMAVTPDRIHAIRAGDTIGEHEIRLAGPSERIHLMHQAVSRDLFAEGALRAARWLAGRAPGSYSMDDVLAGQA
ncbi:MAG: 4-hydroxy-tetrahydrodipicolinate reductase [Planctomycetota bacterium]